MLLDCWRSLCALRSRRVIKSGVLPTWTPALLIVAAAFWVAFLNSSNQTLCSIADCREDIDDDLLWWTTKPYLKFELVFLAFTYLLQLDTLGTLHCQLPDQNFSIKWKCHSISFSYCLWDDPVSHTTHTPYTLLIYITYTCTYHAIVCPLKPVRVQFDILVVPVWNKSSRI